MRVKVLVICLPAFLLLAGFAAWGRGAKEGAPAGASGLTAPGTFPIVTQPITLRILTPNPGGNKLDLNNNAFTDWYEKKTGVHVQWDIIAAGGVTENVNLALSTGNLPDVFMNCNITAPMQVTYGGQGAFVPLNQYIDRSQWYRQAAKAYPVFYATNMMPDGSIYSIPNFSDTYHMTWPYKMFVYQPFLKALGLKEPTTTDEFYAMLKAFKQNDPNGNRQQDEVPFSAVFDAGWASMESYLMSAFIIDPGNRGVSGHRMLLNSRKVTAAYAQDEWKEGLKYLRKLYEEGLMDPQTFTQTGDQLRALGENAVPILGASVGNFSGSFTQWGGKSGRCYDYLALSPLKGPGGQRLTPTNPWKGSTGKFVVTKNAKNPEAAFRWGEGFYNEEIMMRAIYGVPEKDWFVPVNEMAINGKPAKWKGGVEQDQDQNTAWFLIMPYYRTADFRLSQSATNPETNLEVILFNATRDKYAPFGQPDATILPSIILASEANTEAANLAQGITRYVDDFFTQAVRGSLQIDAEWDRYTARLKSMGLPRLLELYQKGYDAQYNK
jgi:putative aldouronate transport system substrate-binding protein